jgi:uncharacterized membrane-anchored protein
LVARLETLNILLDKEQGATLTVFLNVSIQDSHENAVLMVALFFQLIKEFFALLPHTLLVQFPKHVDTQIMKIIDGTIGELLRDLLEIFVEVINLLLQFYYTVRNTVLHFHLSSQLEYHIYDELDNFVVVYMLMHKSFEVSRFDSI